MNDDELLGHKNKIIVVGADPARGRSQMGRMLLMALMSIGGSYKNLQGTLGIYGFAAIKSKRYDTGVHAVVWRMDRKSKPQCYWDPDPDSKWRYYDLTDKALRYYVIVPKPGWYGALTE